MSSPSSSAQAALQALADRLRDLRVDAGMTGVQLATAVGWHRTKVSRIEHTVRPPSIVDVQVWCRACDAEDQADDLVEALRVVEGAYVLWHRVQRTGLRRLQDSYVPLYESTRLLRVYAASVVPGMFQTPRYITAVLSTVAERWNTRNDVEAAVDARLARRRMLHEGDHRHAYLLEESLLRTALGGPDVMVEQLQHLLDVMSLPAVSLGVIPAGAPRMQWPVEQFTIYDLRQVEVELVAARVTVTAPSEIKLYAAVFDDLARLAVHGDAARERIHAAIANLRP